jgi:hypothetical protein
MEARDDELQRAEQRVTEPNKARKETRHFVAYFCIVCIPFYALLIYGVYRLLSLP